MKNKIAILTIFFVGLTTLFSSSCYANESDERIYLIQILNQLDAMQPMIIAAQKAEPLNTRIRFHYTKFTDAQGNVRNGLLEDIQSIKQGIEEEINKVPIEPRVIKAINGDYINKFKENNN